MNDDDNQMLDDGPNHTGRELELMLKRAKPLAMFYDNPNEATDPPLVPEAEFDPYVSSGAFEKATRIFTLAMDPRTGKAYRVRYVLYALTEEKWRIPALFLAIETSLKITMPNEAIDRIKSSLLGYTDQEIEAYFNFQKK